MFHPETRNRPPVPLKFAPGVLVNDADVGLDDLDHLGGDVQVGVVGYGDSVVAVFDHVDGEFDALADCVVLYVGKDEATFVKNKYRLYLLCGK